MSYAFTHATLLDGTRHMEPQPDTTVIVDDRGIIDQIGPSKKIVPPIWTEEVDLGGRYLMPGLVNMHVHFVGNGAPMSSGSAAGAIDRVTGTRLGRAYLRHRVQQSAETELMSGVTTVRGAGDPCWADVQTRDAINAGRYLGPRVLAPGWGITPQNGHGRGLIAHVCETPRDAEAFVDQIALHGADLVKLFITGGVFDAEVPGEPGVVRMSAQMAQAIVQAAHQRGLRTMTHVESTAGVRLALEAGVDTIEHGALLDDDLVALFHHNGVGRASTLTTTISPALPFVRLSAQKTHSSEAAMQSAEVVYTGIVEAAKTALHNDIRVGLGTDAGCPYVTHYDMWREVVYFHRLVGVTERFALYTATLRNAKILGLDHVTGSIEYGKSADMIVLDQNPLEDLTRLRDVRMVTMAGRLFRAPQVRRMPSLDADLDTIL